MVDMAMATATDPEMDPAEATDPARAVPEMVPVDPAVAAPLADAEDNFILEFFKPREFVQSFFEFGARVHQLQLLIRHYFLKLIETGFKRLNHLAVAIDHFFNNAFRNFAFIQAAHH